MKNILPLLLFLGFSAFGQGMVRRVDTVADLLTLNPTNFMTGGRVTYEVSGRTSRNDLGGGLFDWDSTSTRNTNVWDSFAYPYGAATGRWIKLQEVVDIRATGAVENQESTEAIQAALNAAASIKGSGSYTNGGTVYIPSGNWVYNQPFVIPPNIIVRGVGGTRSAFDYRGPYHDVRYQALGQSQLYLEAGANCKTFILDKANPRLYVGQTDEVQEDGSITNTVMYPITFQGFVVFANGGNQTRYDCDVFYLQNAFHIKIEDVGIIGPSGYLIWAQDINQLELINLTTVGLYGRAKGILQYGSGDNLLYDSYIGNADGPLVWFTGGSQWKNQISNNQIYNAETREFLVSSVDTGTGTVTLTANHVYETGMLAEIMRMEEDYASTWPTNMNYFQPYWTIKISTNQLRFATTYSNAMAGTAITFSTSPTGTNYVWHGPPSAIYSSWGTRDNRIIDNRFDQNASHGVYLSDCGTTMINDNTIDENGFSTLAGTLSGKKAAGVYVRGTPIGQVSIQGNTFSKGSGLPMSYGVWIASNVAPVEAKGVLVVNNINYGNAIANVRVDGGNQAVSVAGISTNANGAYSIGFEGKQEALQLVGGSGGTDILILERPGVGTNAFRTTSGGVEFVDRGAGRKIGSFRNISSSETVFQFAEATTADTTLRDNRISGSTPVSGYTNWAATDLIFESPYGTGTNDTKGNIYFKTPVTTTNETSNQGRITRMQVKRDGQVRFVPLTNAPTINVENGDFYVGRDSNIYVRLGSVWKRLNDQSGTLVLVNNGTVDNPNITTPGIDNYVTPEQYNVTNVYLTILTNKVNLNRLKNQSSQVFIGVGDRGGSSAVEPLTISAGSGISLTWPSADEMSIGLTSGGGGATNGSIVTVDGGSDLGRANFADSTTIDPSVTGTNVTLEVIADSLDGSHIDDTYEASLLDRANHTGTQTASTISDFADAFWGYLTNYIVASNNVAIAYDTGVPALLISATATAGATNAVSVNGTQVIAPNFVNKANATTFSISGSTNVQVALADRDFGSFTVSSGGTVATLDNSSVNSAIIQDGSVTSTDMSASGVTAATYNNPTITVDAAGRITAASGNSGPTIKFLTISSNELSGSSITDAAWHSLMGTVRDGLNHTNAAGTLTAGTVIHVKAIGRLDSLSNVASNVVRFGVGALYVECELTDYESEDFEDTVWNGEAWFTVVTPGNPATVIANAYVDFNPAHSGTGNSYFSYRARGIENGSLDTTSAAAISVDFRGDPASVVNSISSTHVIGFLY